MKKLLVTLIFAFIACLCFAQNLPPVGIADTIEVLEQVPILIDVKANDYDPDGDEFWLFDIVGYNAFVELIDEKVWFRSKATHGSLQARYRLRDSDWALSPKTIIFINLLPNPDIPTAVADTIQLMQLASQPVDILNNDTDPNGDLLKINTIYSPSNCSVVMSSDSLYVTVTPYPGSDNCDFRYDVIEKNTSGQLMSFKVLVYADLTTNPDMPQIYPDRIISTGGIEIMADVLDNDLDNQGDLIEIAGFSQPAHGTLILSNNKFYYTPELSYTGNDSFKYSIREALDTTIYTSYTNVDITVLKNPDCPVAVADEAQGMTAVELIIDVLANDYDINDDAFIITKIDGGTITADQKVKYKSSNLQLNADTIFYKIAETGNPNSFSEWTPVCISLAVNPGLPVAVADTILVRGGIPVSFRPLMNDIPNSIDTLIMNFYIEDAPQSGHWGKAFVVKDTFNYISTYQANGVDRFRYRIRSSTAANLAMGDIVFICESKFYDSLEISNINAGVHGSGFLFCRYSELPGLGLFLTSPGWNDNFSSHFRFPKGDRKTTIFNSTLWAGGLDGQNALHLAGERYKQGPANSGGIDYQPGPVAEQYNNDYLMRYLRTWKVSREEVECHIKNYQKPGYAPPETILNWPGNGNTANGEAPLLAPYFDKNADGNYNCLDGDYPLIRGDQTVFLMYNDDCEHTESSGSPILMEVHAMVYGFNTPSDTSVYNSVFVHYDLINRSGNTYTNFYTGIFTDTDLGFAIDDYIGCNVQKGSFYAYNGKPKDGAGQSWAYGENPPAQSVTILAGPYKDEDGLDNAPEDCSESINGLNYGNGIADDERLGLSSFMSFNTYDAAGPYMFDPTTAEQYYNLMQARWIDGTPMQYSGMGHAITGAVGPDCKYMFPGDSDPLNWGTHCLQPNGGYNQSGKYWTEADAQNKSGDRRGIGSVGPFTFQPGQIQEIEVAFCVGEATEGVPGSAVDNLFVGISQIKEQVNNGQIIAPNNELGFNKRLITAPGIKLYPNPVGSYLTFELSEFNESGPVEFAIYDLLGTMVIKGKGSAYSRQTINVSKLSPGLYLLKMQHSSMSRVSKFVKK